jgi:hypothetical protein
MDNGMREPVEYRLYPPKQVISSPSMVIWYNLIHITTQVGYISPMAIWIRLYQITMLGITK